MSDDNPITSNPKALAAKILQLVEQSKPQRGELTELARQLLQRHGLLGLQPVVSSEEIVEAYFRCAITDAMTDLYGLSVTAIPSCINSSHRAVRRVCAVRGHRHVSIEDEAWRRGWVGMQREHPEVNVRVAGHSPKRADLYLVAQGGVVSLEFKYVGAAGVRDVAATAAQLGRHAGCHAEAILILLSSTPVAGHVIGQLAQRTARPNVHILNPIGPLIDVAKGAA